MMVLDTHIWVWWMNGAKRLRANQLEFIRQHTPGGLGVSVISCWEVAKLVEVGRLELTCPVQDWVAQALAYPRVRLLELTPEIAIASTQLPGTFHRDPADQLIVATARVYDSPLLTADAKILNYAYVKTLT
ncbi:MAG: type II toxin-antitoxin system VapC family toxin [Anaerolineae bacterium]|nr:type II toxin-antitoxin system VapC family toxin [Anaerolineae bacterium]